MRRKRRGGRRGEGRGGRLGACTTACARGARVARVRARGGGWGARGEEEEEGFTVRGDVGHEGHALGHVYVLGHVHVLRGARVARADVERAKLHRHLDAELGGALAQVHVQVGAHLPVGVQEQPLRLRREQDRLDLVRIVRLRREREVGRAVGRSEIR